MREKEIIKDDIRSSMKGLINVIYSSHCVICLQYQLCSDDIRKYSANINWYLLPAVTYDESSMTGMLKLIE